MSDPLPGSELLRILINVGQTARRFRFGDVTCAELSHAGLHVPRDEFRACRGRAPRADA